MENEIITPEAQEAADQAQTLVNESRAIVVSNQAEYESAAGVVKNLKKKVKELNTTRKEMTDPLHVTKTKIIAFFKDPIDFLTGEIRNIERKMLDHADKVEEERKAEEEEARKAQEKEAEYQRKLAEKRAETQEKKGNDEAAEEIRQEAEQAVPIEVVVPDRKPTSTSASIRVTYAGEVTDKMALIKAVAEGKAPENLLKVDETVLNQMARALKNNMNYPGVKTIEKKGIASR